MGLAAFIGTTLGKVVLGAVLLVGTVGLVGGGLFLGDFGVEATVIDKECRAAGDSTVTVETNLFGIETQQPISFTECTTVQEGNFVIYNIRSERLRLFESEGGCLLYDSAGQPPTCGSSGGGGYGGGLSPLF
ncbi:MAG: hypothetical protein KY455_05215 [Euryarchaeota archaeon]|nr:hypothetical protein [Euryarchaeota archaeon]